MTDNQTSITLYFDSKNHYKKDSEPFDPTTRMSLNMDRVGFCHGIKISQEKEQDCFGYYSGRNKISGELSYFALEKKYLKDLFINDKADSRHQKFPLQIWLTINEDINLIENVWLNCLPYLDEYEDMLIFDNVKFTAENIKLIGDYYSIIRGKQQILNLSSIT